MYQVRNNAGQSTSGALAAGSLDEASRLLRKEGLVILSLREESAGDVNVARRQGPPKKIKRDDVIFFATQLAVMVDTGVPLTEALETIVEQTDHTGMSVMLRDIADQVSSGVEFSAALAKYPKHFSGLFVALMKASEASGTMGQMLQRVSEYMEDERDTIKKVRGAMTYPVCMLSFCVLVIVALLVFILPRFKSIYEGKGEALPLPTQMLISFSDFIVGYWPGLIVGIVAAIVGGWYYFRTPAGQDMKDTIKLRLPLVGGMYRKACLARSLRTMATMVSTGVTMLDGLAITAQVAGNVHYRRIWENLAERVKEGSTLSDQLFDSDLVPRTVAQMISAGEKTGRLGQVMNRVAKFCEDDLKVAIKTVTNMIEPVMIIVMGLIVGGIALALLLPVFSISKVVAH
jgi:type IV pilus assembly protein PilC